MLPTRARAVTRRTSRRCGCGCRASGRSRWRRSRRAPASSRSAGQRTTCRIGPNTSRSSRAEPVDLEGARREEAAVRAVSGRQRHCDRAACPRAPCARRAPPASACASSSITGPTSVASSAGIADPQLGHRAGQHLDQLARRCRPARTARAAPSSAGRRSGRRRSARRRTTCSGSAEESTIIAFWPPVSAISGTIGPVARGQRAVDRRAPSRSSR